MENKKLGESKTRPDLLECDFVDALELVAKVLAFGKKKRGRYHWISQPPDLYNQASRRHRICRDKDSNFPRSCDVLSSQDEESGLPHIAHEIANLIIVLQKAIQLKMNKKI